MKKILNFFRSHSLKEMIKEWRWLSRYSFRYKAAVSWYIFTGILGTVVSLAGSILSKYIIDAVTTLNSSRILSALIFFVLMQLFQIIIRAISSRINTMISIRINQQITAEVYDKLMNTDWESLSLYHSGDLLTRVGGDVNTVSSSILGWFPELFTRLLQFTGTFGVILYYDKTLALFALFSAPVTLLMSRYVIKMMRHHNEKMRMLSSEMMVFNEESFQNIQLIKSLDRTSVYSEKHRQLQQKFKEASLNYNRFYIQKNTIMSLTGTLVAMLCFTWSIYRLWSGNITYGTMTLFLQLSGSLSAAFSALASLIPSAINAATSAGRIMTLMELPYEDNSQVKDFDSFIEKHGTSTLSIQADAISYSYEDGIDVLSGCDFLAENKQIIALIGPSGEGKTTLLRLLLGIIRPKTGSLQIVSENGDSVPISPATRRLFTYVPQNNKLFSGTIADNLRLIKPNATDEELHHVLSLACADEFVLRLPDGLQTVVKEQSGGFSEGQLQRLCIARALLSDAPFLLMDEATSALDASTEHKIMENIMMSQKNRTCIITTHRAGILNMSDRIYSISHDRIELVSTFHGTDTP